MSQPSSRIGLSGERGAITWVTALVLALLAVAIYLAIVWVPVYVLHWEVKSVVQSYGNQAVKNQNDAQLVENMAHKIRTLQEEEVVSPEGNVSKQPLIDLRPENVIWERGGTDSAPVLHVSFQYQRNVHYPLFNLDRPTTMEVDTTMDISRPDWGPSR